MRFWIFWSAVTSTRTRVTAVTAIAVTLAAVLVSTADADPAQDAAKKGQTPPSKPEKLGLLVKDSRAFPGYNLINGGGNKAYLFDNDGRVVHTWSSEHPSSAAVYLLENGHLFRPAEAVNRKPGFKGPSRGGSHSRIRLGRQPRLGLRVSQRKTIAPPRRDQTPQRKRLTHLLGDD